MSRWEIITGDVQRTLPTLPDGSAQCCVTSPPYWGLRDYGTATWEGGDAECDHSPEKRGGRFSTPVSGKQASNVGSGTASTRDCPCGARRIDAQLGLEPTPEEYVAKMVAVFREVRRVLRDDGTLWLNLGDSYAGGGGYCPGAPSNQNGASLSARQDDGSGTKPKGQRTPRGMKGKDLCGIPWAVAFALRADGWYLRQDIIWHKPNPMPESVTDRCTKAHEYIFLLSKSARYYFDAVAVSEKACSDNMRDGFRGGDGTRYTNGRSFDNDAEAITGGGSVQGNGTRNRRSVWTVTTKPYPEAHFATFPPDLIEPCILAGCPVDGTVLDPFTGSGTTGEVAIRHGRNFIGCELNPEYVRLAESRIGGACDDQALFVPVAPREVQGSLHP